MADDIVTRLRNAAARCWCAEKSQGEPVGKPFFRCESCDDQLQAADEIERLRAAGDELFAALNLQFAHIIPDDVEWAAHAEHCQFATRAWLEARRG